ncbi:MAG: hypothetical protein U9O59_08095 [Actinomycetota bacterium]|nr:hypothetical protein [Actinomycetota bacterium]
MGRVQKINGYLFLILFLILIITFFTRNNIRIVDEITDEATNQPVRKEISDTEKIKFKKDGYLWQLKPLYDYEISGLVIGRMNYQIFSINKYTSLFPIDLCLIWGNNVANKVYQDKRVKFKQDSRWCWVRWNGDAAFNLNEFSNNHLFTREKDLSDEAKKINRGDQITIKGKLVNIIAAPLEDGISGQNTITWKSSTIREDDGKGACEIIYVEDIEVLKKGNMLSRFLFWFSFYGLILIIIWSISCFLYSIRNTAEK